MRDRRRARPRRGFNRRRIADLAGVEHAHGQRKGFPGVVHLLQLALDRPTLPEDAEGIAQREDLARVLALGNRLVNGRLLGLFLRAESGELIFELLDLPGGDRRVQDCLPAVLRERKRIATDAIRRRHGRAEVGLGAGEDSRQRVVIVHRDRVELVVSGSAHATGRLPRMTGARDGVDLLVDNVGAKLCLVRLVEVLRPDREKSGGDQQAGAASCCCQREASLPRSVR